jgi:hypothetical protein
MEVASKTAWWYPCGKPVIPFRWVLLRDPEVKIAPTALLSTDLELSAEKIITYFARRWSVEVTFEEGRAQLGVETQRQWSDKAIERRQCPEKCVNENSSSLVYVFFSHGASRMS